MTGNENWNTRNKGFTQLMKSAKTVVSWGVLTLSFSPPRPFLISAFWQTLSVLWMTVSWQWLYYSACSSNTPRFNPIKPLSRHPWHLQQCLIFPLWSSRFQTVSFTRKHIIYRCNDSTCHFPSFSPHFSHFQYPPLLMQDSVIRSLIAPCCVND